ncbi:MAG: hypothetical protein LBN27_12005 [Prevotellaceae bacterium]|jgi:hypothetical protein|nr:hypothetical protein [Prevotellaceae bacterium]
MKEKFAISPYSEIANYYCLGTTIIYYLCGIHFYITVRCTYIYSLLL